MPNARSGPGFLWRTFIIEPADTGCWFLDAGFPLTIVGADALIGTMAGLFGEQALQNPPRSPFKKGGRFELPFSKGGGFGFPLYLKGG